MKMRRILAVLLGFLLIPAGAAVAAPLHTPHEDTSVTCEGGVLWHFVHNQVDASTTMPGELTATFASAGSITVESYKVLRSVRHYEIVTPTSDTLLTASDSIAEGNLVLSHTECVPGVPPSDECVAGDTVTVTWADVRLGFKNIAGLVESAETSTSLLPGTYSVTLTSSDPVHRAGHQTNQDEEQWYVVLWLNGSVVATTGVIGDLPDADTTMTEVVGTITLEDGADAAVATHLLMGLDYSAHWNSPESVEPTQAVFTCL